MRKRIVILLQVFLMIVLTGCWDYKEYENLANISAMGIDYDTEKNEYVFTVQELPAVKSGSLGGDPNKEPVNVIGVVHTARSQTLYDALQKMQQIVTRKLFFGYTKVVVIGETAARSKMRDIIELFDRSPFLRASINMVITENAQKTIATADYAKNTSSGKEISDLIELTEYSGAALPATLQNFEEMLTISGLEAAVPHVVSISNEPDLEIQGGSGENINADEERIGDQIISGTAVFKADNLAGYLDVKESSGYGWITGKTLRNFKTSATDGGEDSEMLALYRICRSKSKIKVKINNGIPAVELDVQIRGDLRKLNIDGYNYLLTKEISHLETMLNDSVRSDIQKALDKCQKEYNSDIFGFGYAVYRKDHRLWTNELKNKWDEIFPGLQVNINVHSKIINTGTNIREFIIN
jgi:spore germination protein KC